MGDQPLLLVAHGSPDPAHRAAMEAIADRVRRRCAAPVALGFLDHDQPTIAAAARNLAGSGAEVILGVGLLLCEGWHATQDVPARLEELGVAYLGALGVGPLVLDAVTHVLGRAQIDPADPDVAVILVAAGSRRPGALRPFEELVGAATGRNWSHVSLAVASGPGRGVCESVMQAPRPDVGVAARRRVVVVPLLLGPGVLGDRIRHDALAAGAIVTDVVGSAPQIVDAILAAANSTRPASLTSLH
jgi:sirohydrochlorin ferrochelatase